MNMAQHGGEISASQLFQMGAQQQAQVPQPAPPVPPVANAWTCSCGATATGKFYPECGNPFDANDLILISLLSPDLRFSSQVFFVRRKFSQ